MSFKELLDNERKVLKEAVVRVSVFTKGDECAELSKDGSVTFFRKDMPPTTKNFGYEIRGARELEKLGYKQQGERGAYEAGKFRIQESFKEGATISDAEILNNGIRLGGGYGLWGHEIMKGPDMLIVLRAWVKALQSRGYDDLTIVLYGDWADGRHMGDSLSDIIDDAKKAGKDPYKKVYDKIKNSSRNYDDVKKENERIVKELVDEYRMPYNLRDLAKKIYPHLFTKKESFSNRFKAMKESLKASESALFPVKNLNIRGYDIVISSEQRGKKQVYSFSASKYNQDGTVKYLGSDEVFDTVDEAVHAVKQAIITKSVEERQRQESFSNRFKAMRESLKESIHARQK